MRITRLSLAAYGHFTELALDFPTPAGLHVVLGANEAGKSTALAAIEDALFGFPHRSEAAWRHSPRDLRVGLTLRRDDGGERTFWRRKGREPTLLDADGQPVSEAAMAGFLGRVTRERFRRVFGLDDTGLRQGGRAILEGSGDLGESVLEAETGLAGSREALQALERSAAALFGDRRGTRAVWASVDRYDVARRELAERSVRAPDYDRAEKTLAELDKASAAARLEAAALTAERALLGRARATAPARSALLGLHAARSALGDIVRLPADADARRQAALLARAQALRDLDRFGAERRAVVEATAALRVDQMVLAETKAIELVVRDLSRIEALADEIARLGASAGSNRTACLQAARGLGLDVAPEQVRVPASPVRHRARALLGSEAALREAVAAAETALADRRRTLEAAGPEAEDDGPAIGLMGSVVDAVRTLGPLEQELARVGRTAADLEATLADAVAALPCWQGTADALVRLALPLEAEEEAAASLWARAAEGLDAARRTLGTCDGAARRASDDLSAIVAHGAPPSQDMLTALRDERDRVFETVLARKDETLTHTYRGLVREADAAADRRAAQAARVEEIDRLRMAVDRNGLALEEARRACTVADAMSETADADWRAVWACVREPSSPQAMRIWRRRHGEIAASHRALAETRREVEDLRERVEASHRRLDGVLPVERGSLAARLDRASARLVEVRAAAAARTEQTIAADAARREQVREELSLAGARGRLEQWRSEWDALATGLGLPAGGAEVAGETLSLWEGFETARAAWEADERGAAMARASAREYDELLARLKAAVPGAASIDGRGRAVAVLEAALRASETARDEMKRHKEALTKLDAAIAEAARARDMADDVLGGLFALAGVTEEPGLRTAIERSDERMRLDDKIAERVRELRTIDDGLGLDALEAEAADIELPPDEWPARLADIDARLTALEDDGIELARRRTTMAAELRAMGERTTAEATIRMQDELSSMAEAAARYMRLRMAHALLGASIERLRRENQDPLLTHAGGLFRALTRGRYERLEADDDDGRPAMLARRADGSNCPVARLSEGTLDQLYLALRLASLERHGLGAERVPLIADDLLASFDDGRARAALDVLRRFGDGNQTILFTHHGHIAEMAVQAGASLHHLDVE